MKKIYAVLIVVIFVFSLAACNGAAKNDSGGEPINIQISGTEPGTASDGLDAGNNAGGAPGEDWEAKYAPILQAYEEGYQTGFAGFSESDYNPEFLCYAIVMNTVSFLKYPEYEGGLSDWHAIYTLADVDMDGIAELMIGETWKYNERQWLAVYDLWTLLNDRPVRLIVKQLGETNSNGLFISSKGYIADTSMADTTFYTVYSIDESSKSLIEKATFGCDPTVYEGEAIFTMDSTEVSQEEYIQGLEGYGFRILTRSDEYFHVILENPDFGWIPLYG